VLLNQERAREVMERRGLDGLVAQLSINVYYLSDYWGMLMNAVHFDAAFFAVLPRDESQPAVLVMPALELRRLVTQGGTWMPEVVAYTSPLDDAPGALPRDGKPYDGWPVRPGAELTPLETQWVEMTRRHRDSVAGDAQSALARALTLAGLDKARVGTDDARVGGWMADAGLNALECDYDASVFNEIRRVKTADEVELMRRAATINESALRAVGTAMHEGAEWSEMERVYFSSMARQGGAHVFRCARYLRAIPRRFRAMRGHR
jgi:Xaa-Pro aminopeptidase